MPHWRNKLAAPRSRSSNYCDRSTLAKTQLLKKTFQQSKEDVEARLNQLVQQRKNDQAVELLATLPLAIKADREIQRLSHEVTSTVHSQITTDIELGRLERAGGSLNLLKRAGIDDNETWQLGEVLKRFDEIARDVRESKYIQATRKLKLQQRVIPYAKWIDEAIEAANQCIASVEQNVVRAIGICDPENKSRPRQIHTANRQTKCKLFR